MRALLLLLFVSPLYGQVELLEPAKAGTSYRFTMAMKLSGAMTFDRNGRKETLPIEATGTHAYVERIDTSPRSHRHYFHAKSTTTSGLDRGEQSLPEDKRFFVVDASGPQTNKPLTREELSLVAEHFDALSVAGLLPGKTVKERESWLIRDEVVKKLCHFDGIVKNELKGELGLTLNDAASLTIDGDVEGLEQGAKVRISIHATGKFDLKNKIVSELTWVQADKRAEGPVSPAMEVSVRIDLQRAMEAAEPKEVSAALRSKLVPAKSLDAPTAELSYTHPNGQFSLQYGRDWHTVVQSETHFVLRLVIRGELIAQTTITPWKKTDPVRSRAEVIKDFDDATAKQPGWKIEKEIFSKDEGTGDSPRIYSRVTNGKQDDLAVVQLFQLVTAADGRQVVITCVMRPEMADKLSDHLSRIAPTIAFAPAK